MKATNSDRTNHDGERAQTRESCTCKAGRPCTCRGETDAESVARMEVKFGALPPPFAVMARRKSALPGFLAYRDGVLDQGPLSARDRALVQIVAAVAMRIPFCMEKLSKDARKVGITEEEIVQAALIASIQSANSMLHAAHDGALFK